MTEPADQAPAAVLRPEDGRLALALAGAWRLGDARRPAFRPPAGAPRHVVVSDDGIGRWDSSLVIFLLAARDWCERGGGRLDIAGLPQGVRLLVNLVPKPGQAAAAPAPLGPLTRFGLAVETFFDKTRRACEFVGQSALGLLKVLRRPDKLRFSELLLHIQQAGAEGLPIIGLVSFLVGTIIAFQAALQLRRFGATNLVINLVDFSVAREMGAIIVAVVLSGRTAAAYAAELGSMGAGEELDALEISGVSPVDFLVVPRIIALAIVTPLLTLYADVLAILGGAAVGLGMLRIPMTAFYLSTKHSLAFSDVRMGLIKSVAFGVIIAVCGCLRGLSCERDTAGVGRAATSAVVTSILWFVVADAIFGKFFSGGV